MQVSIFDNVTENYEVLDIDFEGKQMFNLEYLKEHIEDTFRLVSNRLNSKEKQTSLDRDIMQAWKMIENVLNNKIREQVNR